MDFTIKNVSENIVSVARSIGYTIIDTKDNGEYNLVRRLDYSNYPRFHVFVRQAGDRYIFSLHLDQKAPSYKGTHAHSGEYEGPVVENEVERIRDVVASSSDKEI